MHPNAIKIPNIIQHSPAGSTWRRHTSAWPNYDSQMVSLNDVIASAYTQDCRRTAQDVPRCHS
eukprot:1914559-Karenia_brevis.AAC.1